MTKTLRALSALLTYPSAELVAAMPEIEAAIRAEGLIGTKRVRGLEPLLGDLRTLDLLELQERYVDLFDKARRLSLHLFEHVHGESRDRGQAMVDLAALYEKSGLRLSAKELPDYLPAFLEYASMLPLAQARSLIGDTAHIIASLEQRLGKRGSPYAAVFAAILALAQAAPVAGEVADEEPRDDLAALDAAWEETAVTFGPGDVMGGSSVDRLKTQIRAGRRDARNAAA
jgi:nitrate reductase delta subunit